MKKKTLILSYTFQNVGDDLFVSMLLNRYKKVTFKKYIKCEKFLIPLKNYKNLEYVSNFDGDYNDINLDEIDSVIYIGGSIFREDKSDKKKRELELIKECKKRNIKFYYLCSNFGPYYSSDYLKCCKEIFKNIDGICFRDKYSYELFKDINNVIYAPDLVFNLDVKANKKIKNSIGISIIDASIKTRDEKVYKNAKEYINFLKNNIIKFIDEGKKVYLFSFCEPEKDLSFINELLNNISNEYKDKITIVNYELKKNGLEKFLNIYSKMEYQICTRFHSLILSMVYNQKMVVLSYNMKINNILNDINSDIKLIDFDNNIDKIIINDEDFKSIKKDKLKELKRDSVKQFENTDKFFKYKKRNKYQKIYRNTFIKKVHKKMKSVKNKLKK